MDSNAQTQPIEYLYRISPFIKNISKEEYKAGNQCFSISQGKDGYIYVANRTGLLEYNGSSWNNYSLESVHPSRKILTSDEGLIYYGHFQDFGYFQRNELGKLVKHSISDSLVSPRDLENENIWSIHKIGKKIYFRSFGKIFIYNGETVNVIAPNKTIYSLFESKGEPYVNILTEGIFLIDDLDDLRKKTVPAFIRDKRIVNVLPLSDQQELVITEFNGLYLKEGENYRSWDCDANELLKNYQLNRCVIINDNNIAFGTIGSGVVIINMEGEIVTVMDKINGLQNNTVLDLLTDINQNLWICLDNGIDYVEVNSPFLYCLDRQGNLGAVFTAQLYRGKLYVGTNQGLFYTDWNEESYTKNLKFEKIEEARGQVWNLKIMDDKLICSYNLGVLQIDEEKISHIGDVGGFATIVHPRDKNIFYQGNYTGILRFEKGRDGNWYAGNWIHNSIGGTKFLQIDPSDNLWAGQHFKNVRFLKLDEQKDSVLYEKEFGIESGFNPNWNVGVFDFEDRVIFSGKNQFFIYDYISESIKPYDWLNEELGDFKSARYIYNTRENEYWFALPDRLGMFEYDGNNLNIHKEIRYNVLRVSPVDDRQNIWRINDEQYVIGLANGFMIYNQKLEETMTPHPKFPLKLIDASCFNEKGKIINLQIANTLSFEIPFKYKNILFNFSIAGRLYENYSILYKLDSDEWINNNYSKSVTFNYLNHGKHKFIVKAIDENGEVISEKKLDIRVLPPWYLNIYSLSFYFILVSLIIYGIYIYNRVKLKKQKLEYLKKIKSANTRRIIQMKTRFLESEIQNKSKQLLNYTIILTKKNEVLIQIKEKLNVFFNHIGISHNKETSSILRIIDDNLSDKNDWDILSAHFDESHLGFLKKIKNEHFNLTPNDLKLCAFLRMNLSSKEIAALLNISFRSVEVKRYRLRKKLGLKTGNNLVEYLMKV